MQSYVERAWENLQFQRNIWSWHVTNTPGLEVFISLMYGALEILVEVTCLTQNRGTKTLRRKQYKHFEQQQNRTVYQWQTIKQRAISG